MKCPTKQPSTKAVRKAKKLAIFGIPDCTYLCINVQIWVNSKYLKNFAIGGKNSFMTRKFLALADNFVIAQGTIQL